MRSNRLPTVADASAGLGAVGWGALLVADPLGPIDDVIALAMLVLVPLAVRLADTPRRDGSRSVWYRFAVLGQPVLAVPGVVSLTMDPGLAATLVALPWAVGTVGIAGFGAWRLLGRGPRPIEELSVDAGLLYVLVGGVALLFDRAGVALAFRPVIVTLTVVHFHYAGSVLPVLAGLAGRYAPGGRPGRILRATTGVIVVGPGLIGAGITVAAFDLPFAGVVEFAAVAVFTTAVALFSLSVIAGVLPRMTGRVRRLLIGGASLAVTASMGFALLYGLARATGGRYVGIDARSVGTMVTYHGQLNAYGFAVPALVGWRLGVPESRARAPGIPFSRLRGGWPVGEAFLERRGLTGDATVSGMMATLEAYRRDGFDPASVAPSVRRFYERSGEYELDVAPEWVPPWGHLAAAVRPVVTRMHQLSVPRESVADEAALTGRVVAVESADDDLGDRAWIRSNADRVSGPREVTYVGVYDRYDAGGGPFLRVVFPLPGGNLTGLLRVENGGDDGDGLVLSSFGVPGNADDAGLYLVIRGFGVRLPLDERLVVEPDGPDATVRASHAVELFGFRVFTLRYTIRLDDRPGSDGR